MKQDQNHKIKANQKYQKVWNTFRDYKKTEGYMLENVFEIYLPFWLCKQNIVVEKDVELDRFSRIILELIRNNISKHSDICAFLGVEEDSFVTMQFHFLLKNDLIRELEMGVYEVTHEGINFLEEKTKIRNIETIEFEYFVTERMDFLKNDLTQDFFDPKSPIDKKLSEGKRTNFSGYMVMQTHQIQDTDSIIAIPHDKKPNFKYVSEQRNDFSVFFNSQFKDKSFYDFSDQSLDAHKRNICFYGLLYVHEENKGDKVLEIRRSKKTVNGSNNNDLEEILTKKATEYLKKNPTFLDNKVNK